MNVDTGLLYPVVAIELLATTILVVLLVGTTALRARERRFRKAARDQWLAALTRTPDGAAPAANEMVLRGIGRREQVRALTGLIGQLSGETARQLLASAGESKIAEVALVWCRSRLWWRRLRGVRTLTMVGADQHDLLALLDDPHPEVRAETTAWVAAHPTPAGVDRLVMMLDDSDTWCRFAAEDSLLRVGGQAVDPLVTYLETPASQRPETALRVATVISSPRFLPAARARSRDARAEVRVAAAGLVTAIDGDQAAAILVDLLSDTEATVRTAAADGLGTLAHWPAAPLLAAALGDPAWDVRRAAAGALRALGAPGRFYLRRALQSPDKFVVDIAQHTLDLPDMAFEMRPR